MSELVLTAGFPYGAPELERAYRKYFTSALLLGIALAYSLLGCYWGGVYLVKGKDSGPRLKEITIKCILWSPPPSITTVNAPPSIISVATPAVRPSTGIPVPVPDAEVNSERTFMTPQQMNALGETSGEGTGVVGGEANIGEPILIQDDSPPPKFVIVEKAPVIIKRVQPVYPEIARKVGLEGTVWIELWVTKEGKVKKAVVVKSTSDIFNQSTIEAATQFVFTPALMQSGPVAVWVTMPFHYRLKQLREEGCPKN